MRRAILTAGLVIALAAVLAVPAGAAEKLYQGSFTGGGTMAFWAKVSKKGVPKAAGPFKVTGLPITCDEGDKVLTLTSPSSFRIPVNQKRKFSYTNSSPKFTWRGQFARPRNKKPPVKATGTFNYGPNDLSGLNDCATDGAIKWTAKRQ